MSEISLSKNSATASPRLALAKLRLLLTELNLHFAGVILLALVNVYLLVHLFFVWRQIQTNDAAALHSQQAKMVSAQMAAEPLRGLDEKVALATQQADAFNAKRLPYAGSQVIAELGKLEKKENVRQTRAAYGYTPVMADTPNQLTELRIDVSLSGDYRPLVHVINALERDKLFFMINSMALSGEQSGAVNLRLRITTYLRPPVGDETTKKLALDETAVPNGAPGAARMPMPAAPARPGQQTVQPIPNRMTPQQQMQNRYPQNQPMPNGVRPGLPVPNRSALPGRPGGAAR